MKRRTFIATAIIGGSLLQIGCAQPADPSARPPAFSALMGADEFSSLGKALLSQLGGMEEVRKAWDKTSSPEDRIAEDFRDGNIVVSEGWVLSRTEALHAALFTASMKEHAR